MLKKIIGESAFKLAGWQYQIDPNIFENKQVIVGFEHTSMMDAILSLALFQIYERPLHETAPLLEAYHQTEKKQRMAMK